MRCQCCCPLQKSKPYRNADISVLFVELLACQSRVNFDGLIKAITFTAMLQLRQTELIIVASNSHTRDRIGLAAAPRIGQLDTGRPGIFTADHQPRMTSAGHRLCDNQHANHKRIDVSGDHVGAIVAGKINSCKPNSEFRKPWTQQAQA